MTKVIIIVNGVTTTVIITLVMIKKTNCEIYQ